MNYEWLICMKFATILLILSNSWKGTTICSLIADSFKQSGSYVALAVGVLTITSLKYSLFRTRC